MFRAFVLCTAWTVANAQSMAAYFDGDNTKYPGTATSKISGVVFATATADKLKLSGTIFGLKADLTTPTAAGNSLGVHVHVGKTCATAEDVGGHYFSGAQDPWTNIAYASDAEGVANFDFEFTKAILGVDPDSVSGRAFVIHNEDGSRAACALLKVVKDAATIKAYPGTESTIKGSVSYNYDDDTVTIQGAVSSVEADKTPTAEIDNSNGVHIHVGKTCENKDDVGGHYYNNQQADLVDPWKNVAYTSTTSGTSLFQISVTKTALGFATKSTAGRAFVVHNNAGGRIGCVVLGTPEPTADTTPEPAADTTPEPAADTTPEPAADTTPAANTTQAADTTPGSEPTPDAATTTTFGTAIFALVLFLTS